jgi:iron complex outermembrane recepter protein
MTSSSYRSALVTTTSALALALTSMPALAQDGQEAQSVVGLEEITVTARRVEENIQRIPIAIQAFTPETLEQQDIRDIWSMTKNIGGLNICCSPGSVSFTFMRGIGNGTPTYFADVPKSAGGFGNGFDIANVQILKGPQGTLFGEASNAGAIIYQPRTPGDVFGGYVSVSAGNYGRATVEAALDIPLIEDRVLFRIAATRFNREGYIQNVRNGLNYAEQKYYVIRPSLTFRPTDNIENTTIFEYVKSNGNPSIFTLDDINFTASPFGGAVFAQALANGNFEIFGGDVSGFNADRDELLATELALGKYKVDGLSTDCVTPLGVELVKNGGCTRNFSRNMFVANTTIWDMTDNVQVKNIIGWAQSRSFSQPGDTDGTRMDLFDGGSPKNKEPFNGSPQFSEELQVNITDLLDRIDLTVGTFHRHEYSLPRVVYSNNFDLGTTASISKTSNRSRAVYAQGNIDLGDVIEGLSVTLGARQSWEKVASARWSLAGDGTTILGFTGGNASPAGIGRFSNLSYTAQIQYQYSPDILFFVNNSRGFGSGGLQNVFLQETYAPDILNNIEVGTKATFNLGDWLVRTNASYYYGWFDNIKVSATKLAFTDATDTQAGLIVVTENAAKGKVEGVDADISIVPVDWLELGAVVAYTNTAYTDYIQLDPITLALNDLSSTPFSFVPKWKWTLRGTYHVPMDSSYGDLSLNANLTWNGEMFNTAKPRVPTDPNDINTGIVCDRFRTAENGYGPLSADGGRARVVDCNPSYYNLDMTLNWRDMLGNEGLSGSVFVTNVTKNEQNDGGCYCNGPLALTSQAPQVPRMFGIRLRYDF